MFWSGCVGEGRPLDGSACQEAEGGDGEDEEDEASKGGSGQVGLLLWGTKGGKDLTKRRKGHGREESAGMRGRVFKSSGETNQRPPSLVFHRSVRRAVLSLDEQRSRPASTATHATSCLVMAGPLVGGPPYADPVFKSKNNSSHSPRLASPLPPLQSFRHRLSSRTGFLRHSDHQRRAFQRLAATRSSLRYQGQSANVRSQSIRHRHRWLVPCFITAAALIALWSSRDRQRQELQVNRYHRFKIKSITQVSDDALVFKIEGLVLPPSLEHPEASGLSIQSVYVKHPALQIERPYTPLTQLRPAHSEEAISPTELLVKKHPDGDMSNYLHAEKFPGDEIEVRGPVVAWKLPDISTVDAILFIAAGTGVTPAIQLLRQLTDQYVLHQHLPKFNLIYLTRSLDSAYFLDEIRDMATKFEDLISLKLVISEPLIESKVFKENVFVDKAGQLDLNDLRKWIGTCENSSCGKKVILVCGPDGLISAVAGPKGSDLRSQGKLGGMLKSLGYTAEQVHKL